MVSLLWMKSCLVFIYKYYSYCSIFFIFVAKEPSDKWWRFDNFITGEELRRTSYRSDVTFRTQEIPEGVEHAKEVKVAADGNEKQIKTNNLTQEPETISSQTSPSPAHPPPNPASTSTSEGDKDGVNNSHSDCKGISKLLIGSGDNSKLIIFSISLLGIVMNQGAQCHIFSVVTK